MKEFTYTVRDACGIHARPAGMLVRLAKGFDAAVTLERGSDSCDLKRLMALMGMGVKQGESILVRADGADEDACIHAVSDFLQKNV